MSKRDKLNLRQKRRITRNKKTLHDCADSGRQLLDGWVVSRFGHKADVFVCQEQQVKRCFMRQHLGDPVSGDKVRVSVDEQKNYCIEQRLERASILSRPSKHGGVKAIAANIDHVFVVVAPRPEFSSVLLDRYLVAVANSDLDCTIILNKCDLAQEIEEQAIDEQLEIYRQLNYPVLNVSCESGQGIDAFRNICSTNNAVLVGQSGVGKSSIINRLFPEQQEKTGKIAEHSKLGKHTTTRSKLFFSAEHRHFIIDSPGVREFALWHLKQADVVAGFKEFEPYLGHCQFRDCSHQQTPGCALEEAVEQGQISQQRWQNFLRISQSLDD